MTHGGPGRCRAFSNTQKEFERIRAESLTELVSVLDARGSLFV
jgi:hypothetical protein